MHNSRLGCLSPLALASAIITLILLVADLITSGSSMFSPGALNAQTGSALGGVTSHAELNKDCGVCHVPFWSRQKMSHLCLSCHMHIQEETKDSATLHGALFRGASLTCQSCHTEHNGPSAPLTHIDPVDFPHEATGFALVRHQTHAEDIPFTCNDCHTERLTTFTQQICIECHHTLNPTYIAMHIQDFGKNCLGCHDGIDRYGDFDHSRVKFALTGAHIGVDCSACHPGAHTPSDLQNTTATCESCHLEDDHHEGKFGAVCGLCHSPEAWKPAQFDHNLSGFPLEGKHADVECESCHTQGYTGTSQDCYTCHKQDDAHDGQYGLLCETCHNPTGWKDATFDHSLSAFPLDGAHVNVECAGCHHNQVFEGTSTECDACHADPVFHAGMFPSQVCSQCHTTIAWRPAQYTDPHTFPMDHGDKNNTCTNCHQPSLIQWTCYTCHEPARIEKEHTKEGIHDFNDCLSCHPTGEEDEAKDTGENKDD